MTLRDSYVQSLEVQNDELRLRVEQLEDMLGMRLDAPIEIGLTASEAKVFGLLQRVEMATKQAIMSALYYERIDTEPELKIVDVFVCKLRAKLKPWRIEIETLWGTGYHMTPESKALAAALYRKTGEDAA